MPRIAYHPPKSAAHGHGPKARSARKAWAATQAFLAEHARASLNTPLSLTIMGPSRWTDARVVEAARAEAAARFGLATGISGEFYHWDLPEVSLEEALEFAFGDDSRATVALGPVRLYVSYAIAWKTLPNPPPDPQAEHFARGSFLGVSVSGRRFFLQPIFLFDASDEDPAFMAQLKRLQQDMPFVPKDTNYYRVEAKKTGKGQKLVKLRSGWQAAV